MVEDTAGRSPRVLMVDDEKEVADAYALRLDGFADVETAHSGDEALSMVEGAAPFDVVLLDRHMPGRSGDEVLQEIRDRPGRAQVIMVTAIDPDLQILDLPFDDYLCKPVERADLHTAVAHQCDVLAYELLGEYFRLESKRAVIEAELPPSRLEADEEYATLDERVGELTGRIRRLLPDAEALLEQFAGVGREGR